MTIALHCFEFKHCAQLQKKMDAQFTQSTLWKLNVLSSPTGIQPTDHHSLSYPISNVLRTLALTYRWETSYNTNLFNNKTLLTSCNLLITV